MDYNYERNLENLHKEQNQILEQMDAKQLNAASEEYADIMENLVKLNGIILNEEKRMDAHTVKILELEVQKMELENKKLELELEEKKRIDAKEHREAELEIETEKNSLEWAKIDNDKVKIENDKKRQFMDSIIDPTAKTVTTLISVLGTGALALIAYDLDAEQVASKGVQTFINIVTKFFPKNN